MDWKCGEWSECVNSLQTRQCEFVKVSQHVQDTQCPTQSEQPITSQKCEVQEVSSTPSQLIATTSPSPQTPQASSGDKSLSSITGGAVTRVLSNPKAVKEFVIGALILAITGALGYKFLYKRK